VRQRSTDELPAGEVLIRVHYSGLNYKDALSANGHRGVTRKYPHTPGIDAGGVVEESTSTAFKPGDQVIVTGFDLGMNTAGGFGEYIRVPADWIVPLPPGLSLRESMVYGTAGVTAALCIAKLQQEAVTPDQGEIVVTGATGGVGSLAVAMLARLGYRAVAATGKAQEHEFLKRLGAAQIVPREEVDDKSGKPLLPPRWAGAVDTVGGNILSTLLRAAKPHGVVTCCGMVTSTDLQTSIYPFILRSVTLAGIDSVNLSMPERRALWSRLAGNWKPPALGDLGRDCALDQLNPEIERILNGQIKGRVVVRHV
jgi:putative YhdH/YhfP family quinone oxidoreductase